MVVLPCSLFSSSTKSTQKEALKNTSQQKENRPAVQSSVHSTATFKQPQTERHKQTGPAFGVPQGAAFHLVLSSPFRPPFSVWCDPTQSDSSGEASSQWHWQRRHELKRERKWQQLRAHQQTWVDREARDEAIGSKVAAPADSTTKRHQTAFTQEYHPLITIFFFFISFLTPFGHSVSFDHHLKLALFSCAVCVICTDFVGFCEVFSTFGKNLIYPHLPSLLSLSR